MARSSAHFLSIASAALFVTAMAASTAAVTTNVTINVLSKDAKFIGTSTGLAAGICEVTVTGFDPRNGNAGLDVTTFVVR